MIDQLHPSDVSKENEATLETLLQADFFPPLPFFLPTGEEILFSVFLCNSKNASAHGWNLAKGWAWAQDICAAALQNYRSQTDTAVKEEGRYGPSSPPALGVWLVWECPSKHYRILQSLPCWGFICLGL